MELVDPLHLCTIQWHQITLYSLYYYNQTKTETYCKCYYFTNKKQTNYIKKYLRPFSRHNMHL